MAGKRETEAEDMIVYRQKTTGDRVWDIGTRLLIPIAVFAGGVVANHETRLTKIESNRFTQDEGNALEQRTASKTEIGEVKHLLERMDTRLQTIDARTVRLETKIERIDK